MLCILDCSSPLKEPNLIECPKDFDIKSIRNDLKCDSMRDAHPPARPIELYWFKTCRIDAKIQKKRLIWRWQNGNYTNATGVVVEMQFPDNIEQQDNII